MVAVSKLDHVLGQIELLKELAKVASEHSTEAMKQLKKQVKADRHERWTEERKRILTMIRVQYLLDQMGDADTRQKFADGTDGACQLTEEQLAYLDELYKLLNQTAEEGVGLEEIWAKCAEHYQSLLDCKDKPVCGTTYRDLHHLLDQINQSEFMDKLKNPISQQVEVVEKAESEFEVVETQDVPSADSQEVQAVLPPEVPPQPTQDQIFQTNASMPAVMQQQPPSQVPTFEKIVEKTKGQFNFLQQDSQEQIQHPLMDPAVLSVTKQQVHGQYQPGMNSQPTTVVENSMYREPQFNPSQKFINEQPKQEVFNRDPPNPIPLPNETKGFEPVKSQSPTEQTEDRQSPAQESDDNNSGGDNFESRGGYNRSRGRGRGGYNGQSRGGGGYRGDRGGYRGRGNYHNGQNYSRGGRGGNSERGYRGGYQSNRGNRGGRGSYQNRNPQSAQN